ncbi:MAG: DnaD domain protein [Dehalococcoidia bacterium]
MRPSRFDEEGVGLQVDVSGDGGRFAGFPSSGLATPVPNLFFSRVLPRIERPEELAVSLYFFFAQTLKRRSPRFLTRRELAADGALSRSLAALGGGEDGEALERGLLLAVERGTLFRATVEIEGGQEELYLVNTPANRRAAEGLAGARLRLEEPLPPAAPAEPPNIFVLYEENVGGITPLIADELKQAEEIYPAEWIREAFREAVSLNKRSWRYIQRILERWEAEGPNYEKAGRDPEIEWLERRYREDKRGLSSRRARA